MDKKQTAIDFLWTKASSGEHLTPEDFEQAKAIEKQQIKDAQMDMFNNTNKNKFGLDYLNKRDAAEEYAEQYYNETFKSE